MSDAISTKNRIIDEVSDERDRLLDAYGDLTRWIRSECVHEPCRKLKPGTPCIKRLASDITVPKPASRPDIVLCESARSEVHRAKALARGQ